MAIQATDYQSVYQDLVPLPYIRQRSNKLFVLPLTHTADNLVTPEVMAYVWNQIVSEGKLESLFYDGCITNLREWLDYIYNRNNYVSIVLDDSGRIYHIAWINKFMNGQGFLHHCSIGNYNRGTWPALFEYFKKMNYEGKPLIRTLMGVTPANNRKAIRLLTMLGWKALGEIPGICYIKSLDKNIPGVISYKVVNEV